VVDIGEEEPSAVVGGGTNASTITLGSSNPIGSLSERGSSIDNMSAATMSVTNIPQQGRDSRIDEVVALLGEYMPSGPNSNLASYFAGFMSLRLLLLRSSRSTEEDEILRTILDSYSSYSASGRARSDISIMLARDYVFLNQQQMVQQQQHPIQQQNFSHHHAPPAQQHHQQLMQRQQHVTPLQQLHQPFLSMGQGMMAPMQGNTSSSAVPLFCLPSTNSSHQNSPALTPIPVPGSIDVLSIVSNN
jgi:hypothetical protein